MELATGARHGRLTATQLRVFDELLAIGGSRPVAPATLVDELRREIIDGTRSALAAWPEPTMWVGKSVISTTLRCEGQVLADASTPRQRRLPTPTAVGLVVHRAIQMHHTHPGRSPEELVRVAMAGCRSEEGFAEWSANAGDWEVSDLQVSAVNRLCAFLDTFPPLESAWVPRFEDSISARFGGLVLAARPDLVLGRPRGDGRQTMFLCDFKSGDLHDEHHREAMFYALVSTLRHGVPPFRSCVLSLASGEWTEPDVTDEALFSVARDVAAAVRARGEVLGEIRPPVLNPGRHCSWCPARATCPAAVEASGVAVAVAKTPAGVQPETPAPAVMPDGRFDAPGSSADATVTAMTIRQPTAATAAVGDNPWVLD
jgi:hypothetical protein